MTNSGSNTPQVQSPQTPASHPPTPQAPTLLNNRYRVVKVLGDGGFGTTFLAVDMQMPSRRQCVIKQLKPIDNNPQIYQLVKDRFQREAAILERLGESHDQIPMLYAFLEEAGQFYLVEEWVAGQTLTQKMQQSGPLSEMAVREILVKLLPVIDYIHQARLVHRDIKPDNIILRQTDGIPILIDFGAVKETMSTVVNSQGQTNRSIVVGTPGYMAMEQLAGRPMFSSDLYSLGLTAIYLLTRKVPQELETDPYTGTVVWQHLTPHLSPELIATLTQAIQPQPRERFSTAAEMLHRLVMPTTDIVDVASLEAMVVGEAQALPVGRSENISQQETIPLATKPEVASPPSAPLSSVVEPTQAVIPQHPPSPPVVPQVLNQTPRFPLWQKAVLTGGVLGIVVLLGAVLMRDQLSNWFAVDPQPSQPTPSSSLSPGNSAADKAVRGNPSTPTATTTEPPRPADAPVSPSPVEVALPSNADQTNASIVGESGSKNIRSGPGTHYAAIHIAYPGDRVTIIRSDRDQGGFLWHNVYFPQSQAQGWIAAQLIRTDQTPAPPTPSPSPSPPVTPKPTPESRNATIIGTPESKNIRTGPGTQFPTQHIAYPGDRVQIVGQGKDKGGYLWYEIYFPESGARGWIAAQLLEVD
ncbi:MAG: protein kinase [Acaryochloris sp. SU_5_25]|nr:protein kinase [Acaryochloris sp. SU_5_25]